MRVGLWRKLSTEELMLSNCGIGEDCSEIQPVNPEGNQSWILIERTDAEAEAPILWPLDAKNWLTRKDPDAGKDWRQEEQGTTGWDGRMASPTQWTSVWVNPRSWWWTGRPGVLQSMGLQRVGTRLSIWTELMGCCPGPTEGCKIYKLHTPWCCQNSFCSTSGAQSFRY